MYECYNSQDDQDRNHEDHLTGVGMTSYTWDAVPDSDTVNFENVWRAVLDNWRANWINMGDLISGINPEWAYVTLSGDQSTNLSADDHVEFDTIQEAGSIILATGSGQANGLITLEADQTYELKAVLAADFSGPSGNFRARWYDETGAAYKGQQCEIAALTHTQDHSSIETAFAVFTPSVQSQVSVRIVESIAVAHLHTINVHAMIRKLRTEE